MTRRHPDNIHHDWETPDNIHYDQKTPDNIAICSGVLNAVLFFHFDKVIQCTFLALLDVQCRPS